MLSNTFRKDNYSNWGIMIYVRNDINDKRREYLEINNISCIWLEISQDKGKSFLIGNMYRPPDSRIEYNDRFEDLLRMRQKKVKKLYYLGILTRIYLRII